MPVRSQVHRWTAVSSPLGEDVLLLRQLTGVEELGRLFQYELDLCSEDKDIDFDQVLGENMTVRINLREGGARFINGYASRFERTLERRDLTYYRLTLTPWLWFLTRTSNCRIFQNKTAVEIIEDVFKIHGFSANYENRVPGALPKREYCVQYRETDFAFVSRLMEEEGVYYYFRHEDGKHTLVLSDSKSSHDPAPGFEQIAYRPAVDGNLDREHIVHWTMMRQIQPGCFEHTDFDFTAPNKALLAQSRDDQGHASAGFQLFDYPGNYTEKGHGDTSARTRLEQRHAEYEVYHGEALSRGITCGCLFGLEEFPQDAQNMKYLITSTTLNVASDEFETVAELDRSIEPISCSFTAIPETVTFRSRSITLKPVVHGPQTAIVVGPEGEEIHTDEYGRVKVQFHWDRYGAADENSSCFIRVAQPWAGKNWGSIHIPRIGHEVVVEFLDGDPDCPIITGNVYNGENNTPYALPQNATISTLKSNSSKGGQGFNEIRFEDKKGEEQIFIHGQKNIDKRILNDSFELVKHNRHLIVENDRIEKVANDHHENVGRDHVESTERDHSAAVKGKEMLQVTGSQSSKVGGDVTEVHESNHSEEVTGDYYLKASNIVIEATTSITINVGESFIAIGADGIALSTTGTIKCTGTAGLTLESTATADLKSPMTTVTGDAILTLKGGLVKIN